MYPRPEATTIMTFEVESACMMYGSYSMPVQCSRLTAELNTFRPRFSSM